MPKNNPITQNANKRGRTDTLIVCLLCSFVFLFGVFASTHVWADQAKVTKIDPRSPEKAVQIESLSQPDQALEPKANQQLNPSLVKTTSNDLLVATLKAIELSHATFFAILVVNIVAIVIFFAAKYWPSRHQTLSRFVSIDDKIKLDRYTTLYVARVKNQDLAIIVNPKRSTVCSLSHRDPPQEEPADSTAKSKDRSFHNQMPLTDDEEVNEAVRSMINSSKG